jgi:hypothetical protein
LQVSEDGVVGEIVELADAKAVTEIDGIFTLPS